MFRKLDFPAFVLPKIPICSLNDFGVFSAWIIIGCGLVGIIILYLMDERYKFFLFMLLGSHLWVYSYGDPNPRYYLQFIILWYYVSFYPIYLILEFLVKKLGGRRG